MKTSNFFNTEKFGYPDNNTMSYYNELKSVGITEIGFTLFSKQTVGVGIASFVIFGIYGIPLTIFIAFAGRILGNLVCRAVYPIFGTSRKVRWNTNSMINYVLNSWFWIWTGGALFIALVMLSTIPYGLYHIVTWPANDYSFDFADPRYNLLMRWVFPEESIHAGLVEFFYRTFIWDNHHPIISTMKTIASFCIGDVMFFNAHQHVSKEQFLEDEATGRDGWLLYEKIFRSTTSKTLLAMAKEL